MDEMELLEIFQERLREAMRLKGWSQSEAARRLEMTPQQFGEYYHGKSDPCLKQMHRFAKAFQMPAKYFLDEVSNSQTGPQSP